MSNAFLYVVTILIWGSTWFAIEFQLGVVAPEASVAYRYLAAAVILFLWCKFKGLPVKFEVNSHKWFALMGLLMFSLNYILAYSAQIYITSALSAVAFTAMLWMNILNARVFFGIRVGARVYFGALFGIVGIGILFGPQVSNVSFSDGVFLGLVFAVTGAFMASLGNIASQAAQNRKLPVVQSNAWSMLYGGLFTTIFAVAQGKEFSFDPSAGYVISLAYLTIFGSVIAFGAYLTLLGRIGAHKAGYASVMFPVIALVFSALFEGLTLDFTILFGVTLVLAGNLLVLTRNARNRPSA